MPKRYERYEISINKEFVAKTFKADSLFGVNSLEAHENSEDLFKKYNP